VYAKNLVPWQFWLQVTPVVAFSSVNKRMTALRQTARSSPSIRQRNSKKHNLSIEWNAIALLWFCFCGVVSAHLKSDYFLECLHVLGSGLGYFWEFLLGLSIEGLFVVEGFRVGIIKIETVKHSNACDISSDIAAIMAVELFCAQGYLEKKGARRRSVIYFTYVVFTRSRLLYQFHKYAKRPLFQFVSLLPTGL
jgi:hypothetical protein